MEPVQLTADQQEEKDVLISIYDGDPNFTPVADNHYQYKFESDDPIKSLILDIQWGPDYPSAAPQISLDPFYSRHVTQAAKESLVAAVTKEAENWLGSPMTYTLFQHVMDNLAELTAGFEAPAFKPQAEAQATEAAVAAATGNTSVAASTAGKAEQLTKAQKRRLYDKMDNKGELPRGWDWVDVIRHLAQTGGQQT